LIVVGALTASFVSVTLPIRIVRDVFDATKGTILKGQVIFDADKIVNSIFPKVLPLLLTLGVYYLYSKKKWSPLKLMGLILVLACVLTVIGYYTGVYA
jgi:mannose/fructose/N-acetylgalactosamine-specific phosphotransferase system component IID